MTRAATLVLTGVEIEGRAADVAIRSGRVAAIGPVGSQHGDDRIVAHGGALLPGLHDHHVHLLAAAAARRSIDAGRFGPGDADVLRSAVAAKASGLAPGQEVRVIGYDDAIAGPLDREALDRWCAGRSVRVQHRTGQLWVLNSAALDALGHAVDDAPEGLERDPAGRPTGRCWRIDGWLRHHRSGAGAPESLEHESLDHGLAAVGAELLARGVTGCTDATPFATLDDAAPLLAATTAGSLGVRLTFTGGPSLADAALPEGIDRGPVKLQFDDHDPPPFDDLLTAVRAARSAGRPVAVHCVTAAGLAYTIALLDSAGAASGDRIEHGAVIPPDMVPELRRLGLTVVTQPAFPVVHADRYRRDVEAAELADLWPCSRLVAAGVPVAAGSDAPHGPLDPWFAIAAAATRQAADGRAVGGDPPLAVARALDLYLGSAAVPGQPRRVEIGAPADLVLLDAPLATVMRDLVVAGASAVTPVAVIAAGRVHHAPGAIRHDVGR